MKGWIIDCYPDPTQDAMVVWLRTNSGVERLEDPRFRPSFYVWAPQNRKDELLDSLKTIGLERYHLEQRRTWLGEKEREVVRIEPSTYAELAPLARTIDRWGLYRDYRLYNVDFRMEHRYFMAHDLFPMGLLEYDGRFRHLDTPWRLDYALPDLRLCALQVDVEARQRIPTLDDRLHSVRLNDIVLDGPEETILQDLETTLRELDPDVLVSDGGDSFYLDYLAHRATQHRMSLTLGREGGMRQARGKSYFTYGRIVYKAPAHKLRGRLHVDRAGSFMYDESGLDGIIDLARMSRLPPQEMSRMSPGTAISSMQVNEALRSGTLVLWKKNLPEDFKTAGELLLSDRGGFIYEPKVGLHENVVEVDFASLYPSIMVVHNLSPETLKCSCCPDTRRLVPEIGYRICERQDGLLPRVLRPLIRRRLALKRLTKEGGRHAETYSRRAKALKWVLVTCFGYTGYRNARFGRIECHEAINAYGREILLHTAEMAQARGFRILHGIVDSLWLEGKGDAGAFCSDVTRRMGIPLQLEGTYRWIVFLPNISNGVGALNRYYGLFEDGELKLRGIALRRSDTPELVRGLQTELLDLLSRCHDGTEFRQALPEAMEVTRRFVERVRSGTVPLEQLVMVKRVSKEVEEYAPRRNESLQVLQELKAAGFRVPPGEMVEYVVLADKRARPRQFLDGDEAYHAERYVDLLLRATSELFSPFGYDLEELRHIMGRGASG